MYVIHEYDNKRKLSLNSYAKELREEPAIVNEQHAHQMSIWSKGDDYFCIKLQIFLMLSKLLILKRVKFTS